MGLGTFQDFLLRFPASDSNITDSASNITLPGEGGHSAATYFTYFFISLPLHVTAATVLQRLLELVATKWCSRWSQFKVCRGAAH